MFVLQQSLTVSVPSIVGLEIMSINFRGADKEAVMQIVGLGSLGQPLGIWSVTVTNEYLWRLEKNPSAASLTDLFRVTGPYPHANGYDKLVADIKAAPSNSNNAAAFTRGLADGWIAADVLGSYSV